MGVVTKKDNDDAAGEVLDHFESIVWGRTRPDDVATVLVVIARELALLRLVLSKELVLLRTEVAAIGSGDR